MEKVAIGIDLGGTNLKGVIMNRAGECRHLTRFPTEASKGGAQILKNIIKLIGELAEKEKHKELIVGVGIGTPGFVDEDGTMIGGCANLPGWKGTNIYRPIAERFNLPTTAANDVTVAALAEARFGAGRGVKNMVCLAMGTGIGGGLVLDGKLFKGTHGMAAELGHIVVETNGLQCNCGQKGCVEQYGSNTGIVRNAKLLCAAIGDNEVTPFVNFVRENPETVDAKAIYDFVAKSDPIAIRLNEYVCDMIARAIGIFMNTLSPDRVVLGGGVMKAGDLILGPIKRHTSQYCWGDIYDRSKIVIAECSEDAGVLGAAAMVFDELDSV